MFPTLGSNLCNYVRETEAVMQPAAPSLPLAGVQHSHLG